MKRLTAGQKAKEKCREELENVYDLLEDRWGNYKIETKNRQKYRIKFQKQTIRFEIQFGNSWAKMRTVSYKDGIKQFKSFFKTIKTISCT